MPPFRCFILKRHPMYKSMPARLAKNEIQRARLVFSHLSNELSNSSFDLFDALGPHRVSGHDVLHDYTSFLSFGSSASFFTSSLTFCAWLLCASRVASSVWTRMESRRPTTAVGVRRPLERT